MRRENARSSSLALKLRQNDGPQWTQLWPKKGSQPRASSIFAECKREFWAFPNHTRPGLLLAALVLRCSSALLLAAEAAGTASGYGGPFAGGIVPFTAALSGFGVRFPGDFGIGF